jgi:hypothetical protein
MSEGQVSKPLKPAQRLKHQIIAGLCADRSEILVEAPMAWCSLWNDSMLGMQY